MADLLPKLLGTQSLISTSHYCWPYLHNVEVGLQRGGWGVTWSMGEWSLCVCSNWADEECEFPKGVLESVGSWLLQGLSLSTCFLAWGNGCECCIALMLEGNSCGCYWLWERQTECWNVTNAYTFHASSVLGPSLLSNASVPVEQLVSRQFHASGWAFQNQKALKNL